MDESIEKMCCLLTVDTIYSHKKKKRNYAICNNTDKPWGHQIK